MGININVLLKKLLVELEIYNPKYTKEFDDPAIDTYYISINQYNYIVLYGSFEVCHSIAIYNKNDNKYNIMTTDGLNYYVNYSHKDNSYNFYDEMGNIIFKLELDTFDGNIYDLILFLTNSVKTLIPF